MTQRENDPIYYWDNLLTPLVDEAGQVQRILCISRDTSQQILAEKRLEHAYTFDDLTQLYNRRAFHDLLENYIQQAQTDNSSVGLIMLDLDYFKNLNDTLGYMAGDHLLKLRARPCWKNGACRSVTAVWATASWATPTRSLP